MKLPRWYKVVLISWMAIIAPFWWFAAAFNGYSFFSLPVLSGPSEGSGWQFGLALQLLVIFAFFSPLIFLPVALLRMFRARRDHNAQNQ